jgi:hypothetical protein
VDLAVALQRLPPEPDSTAAQSAVVLASGERIPPGRSQPYLVDVLSATGPTSLSSNRPARLAEASITCLEPDPEAADDIRRQPNPAKPRTTSNQCRVPHGGCHASDLFIYSAASPSSSPVRAAVRTRRAVAKAMDLRVAGDGEHNQTNASRPDVGTPLRGRCFAGRRLGEHHLLVRHSCLSDAAPHGPASLRAMRDRSPESGVLELVPVSSTGRARRLPAPAPRAR